MNLLASAAYCSNNGACGSGCASGDDCIDGPCVPTTCSDGVLDGSETDVDCGGSSCPPCLAGKTCGVNPDCLTSVCSSGTCGYDCGTVQCEWDWRNVDGSSFVTPVRNEGSCGASWAISAVDTIESQIMIQAFNPSLQPALSVQELLSCDTADGNTGCSGGDTALAFAYIQANGIVSESSFPYQSSSGTAPACPAPLPGTRTFIRGYSTVSGTGDPTAVKQAIVSGGPVATILDVYANLLDYQSGVYTHGGAAVGNHGITLVGYSESGGYWIARNSWGTAWGMSGYFLIGYAENNVTLELEFSVLPGAIVE